jgi:hypothetical protein
MKIKTPLNEIHIGLREIYILETKLKIHEEVQLDRDSSTVPYFDHGHL